MLQLQIMEVLDTDCGAKSKQGRKLREATTAFFSLGKCKNIKILTENMQSSKAAHARIILRVIMSYKEDSKEISLNRSLILVRTVTAKACRVNSSKTVGTL